MKPVYYKRFDFDVTASDESVSKDFELEKDVVAITGLLLTADTDELLYYRGTQRIMLNGVELFPEHYESKLLMSGLGVAPNNRYYSIGRIPTINGKLKVEFKDRDNPNAPFSAYRVSVYVRGLKKELS